MSMILGALIIYLLAKYGYTDLLTSKRLISLRLLILIVSLSAFTKPPTILNIMLHVGGLVLGF